MLLAQHESGGVGIRACAADEVVLVSGEHLRSSFLLSAASGLLAWNPADPQQLTAADLGQVIAAQPDIFLLGTGTRQRFPAPAVMAACLSRRIGIEVMDNAAAARTFNVLSGEGRSVWLGMILPGPPQTSQID
jgi:uncharacterized protein